MKRIAIAITGIIVCAFAFAEPPAARTTLQEQTSISVTAYNNDVALVRDVRKLSLPTGEVHLEFSDVAEKIRPETVNIRSLSAPGSIAVLEQNYEYDLISPQKLMDKYVGKDVTLVNFSNQVGFQQVTARLLSNNEGPVYKVGEQIFLGHPGNVSLPEMPSNLVARPSLEWLLNNTAADQQVEATYLTSGLAWNADYVINLAKDEQSLACMGWVTMNNQSGATYTNAQLKLVAGALNIVQPPREEVRAMLMSKSMDMAAGAPPMPREEAFAEYHLYTLPRNVTIREKETKQVALLSAAKVKCGKKYELRGQNHWYMSQMPPMEDQHVGVYIEFRNDEAAGMGIALPGGVMRVYQEDSDGMLQFAGEDRIDHTPKDEDVSIKIGEAFDVVGDRIQTDYQRINNRVHESAYEITIRNHKQSDIVVELVEPLQGDWKVVEKSMDFEKKDAGTIVFKAPVKKDGETKVTYRVRVEY